MATVGDLRVHVGEFEGPLSLLLQLIERDQLAVTRVSVVAVADQFLSLVAQAQGSDLSAIGEFLAMAARLLLIKSRVLLQGPNTAPADPDQGDDAELLARQIAEYRQFQQAAAWLDQRWKGNTVALPRPARKETAVVHQPPAIQSTQLQRAAARLLTPPPLQIGVATEHWPDVEYRALREALLAEVTHHRSVPFPHLCRDAWHPLVIITFFIAVLDAVRAQLVSVRQEEAFGMITVWMPAPEQHGLT